MDLRVTPDFRARAVADQLALLEFVCPPIKHIVAGFSVTWLADFTITAKLGNDDLAMRRAEEVCHVTARLPRVRQHYGRSRRGAVMRVHGGRKTRQCRNGHYEKSAMHIGLQLGQQDINRAHVPARRKPTVFSSREREPHEGSQQPMMRGTSPEVLRQPWSGREYPRTRRAVVLRSAEARTLH
jgi:hypothetical protein